MSRQNRREAKMGTNGNRQVYGLYRPWGPYLALVGDPDPCLEVVTPSGEMKNAVILRGPRDRMTLSLPLSRKRLVKDGIRVVGRKFKLMPHGWRRG